MTLHGSSATVGGVFPDGVISTFLHESAAMAAQVLQQIAAFHGIAPWGTCETRVEAESRR